MLLTDNRMGRLIILKRVSSETFNRAERKCIGALQ